MSTPAANPPAAYERALEQLRLGRTDEGFAALRAAEAAGEREASMVLADARMRGQGLARDLAEAVVHLERAAARPWGPPEHLLAAIHRVGHGVPADDAAAWRWLRQALAAGHRPSLRMAGILRHALGDLEGARALYEAAGDDPFAHHALGLLAAEAGDRAAAEARWSASPLPVSAKRRGGPAPRKVARQAARWGAADEVPPWHDLGGTLVAQGERLHGSPRVEVLHDALAAVECDYLVTIAHGALRRSSVIDPRDGRRITNPVRTSSGASLSRMFPDVLVDAVGARLAALARLPQAHSEPLGVLHYRVGEEYRPHYDWLEEAALAADALGGLGQRVTTVVAYLDAAAEGGATSFPALGIEVAPREGSLLCFDNVTGEGVPDKRSLHCGDPVRRGEKHIVTAWFRARPLSTADRIRDLEEPSR